MKSRIVAILALALSSSAFAGGGYVASVVHEDGMSATVKFKKNSVSLEDLELFARVKAQIKSQFGARAGTVSFTIDPVNSKVFITGDKKTSEMNFDELPPLE